MKLRKTICAVLACAVGAAVVGCGAPDGGASDGPAKLDPSLSLGIQVQTLVEGECNAFVATAKDIGEGVKLVYEVAASGGSFSAVGTTYDTTLVYRCNAVGEYKVRVRTEDGKLVSQTLGFSVVEFGGETFGRSPVGDSPSVNVDLNNDYGVNAVIEHKAVNTISDEYAYVKGVYSDSFYFTVDVDIVGTNSGDQNPKSGIFCRSGKTKFLYAFDVKPNLMGDEIVFVKYTESGGWGWPGKVMHASVSFREGGARRSVGMGLLRKGETFYMFIDGVCIGMQKTGFTENTSVGTYTMAQNTIYSGYACYDAESEDYAVALAAGVQKFGA